MSKQSGKRRRDHNANLVLFPTDEHGPKPVTPEEPPTPPPAETAPRMGRPVMASQEVSPDFFKELLDDPLVKLPLPKDFRSKEEAEHLMSLWTDSPNLHEYSFERFVHAGGSGMVFKVRTPSS